MKMKVKVEEKYFEVDIGNLSERPISVEVNGEKFEVWPDSESLAVTPRVPHPMPKKEIEPQTTQVIAPPTHKASLVPSPQPDSAPSTKKELLAAVKAPIPGVITAILVEPGFVVEVGQELCKLEAMKMNNSIRSSRSGKIGTIKVSIGQHVKHNDTLIEFVE